MTRLAYKSEYKFICAEGNYIRSNIHIVIFFYLSLVQHMKLISRLYHNSSMCTKRYPFRGQKIYIFISIDHFELEQICMYVYIQTLLMPPEKCLYDKHFYFRFNHCCLLYKKKLIREKCFCSGIHRYSTKYTYEL